MNNELHHKWNATRTPSRGSDADGEIIRQETLDANKVTLQQVSLQRGKTNREV